MHTTTKQTLAAFVFADAVFVAYVMWHVFTNAIPVMP